MIISTLRRTCIAAVIAFACVPAATLASEPVAPASSNQTLQHSLEALVQRARPGTLGIAVLDLTSGNSVRINADRAFPMMSVFKAPVAAAVLSHVDDGSLSLQQVVTITREQVQGGSAIPSIGAHFHGEQMTFTVEQLLKAAVSESDNTAVNALIRTVGGPDVVMAYLRSHGMEGMRVDTDEAGISQVFYGLRPGETESAQESDEAVQHRRQAGYAAFLADPRNCTTPDAAIVFLRKLTGHELLSPASTQRLLALMHAQTIPSRLRAGIPNGLQVADKTGTSGSFDGRTGAYNDIGIITWPNGRQVLVAAFLLDSRSSDEQAALFAGIARAVVESVRP